VRVSQERTLEGRLFQIAGAAERKPRAPDEMLKRVTERRLAVRSSPFMIMGLDRTYHVGYINFAIF